MPIFDFFNRPNVLEMKSKGNVEGLLDALDYEKDANIRSSAAWALGEIGDSSAIDGLIEALKDNKQVREIAAKSLGEIGDPHATEALIERLSDRHWEVRGTAAKSLGKLGDSRATYPLIDLLGDGNENVRWNVVQALESITGEAFGESQDNWQAWWEQNRE
jgi:HEAT repeat protein